MTAERYPEWPAVLSHHETREQAIAAALIQLDPGDTLTVHGGECASRFGDDCACSPDVIVVPEARA